jgi:two-component system response regulator YcbB
MKLIFIVDDDISIVNILKDIVNQYFQDFLVGYELNARLGIKEIISQKPDIVLLDYLLPDRDGLEIIREIKKEYNPLIVMISEVSDKEMIAKAYKEKIEFFITKPINVIEVVTIINKLIEYREMKNKIYQVENIISVLNKTVRIESDEDRIMFNNHNIRNLYSKLGIIGVTGCEDLIKAVLWVKSNNGEYTLSDMYKALVNSNDKKQVYLIKKRIRRVITKAFKSMAYLGNEDFMNPIFEEYSNRLFDIEELRNEMNYISKKSGKNGKISIKKFIESSIIISENIN